MNVIGPDNSHHQDHTLDYAKVAKTCRLAIHKANEFGADERFAERWKAMAAAGLVRGAYDFLLLFPTAPTGATQAAQYLGIVKAAGGFAPEDLQPIADIERGPADPPNRHPNQDATRASTIERINSWAAAIESAGLEPTVYGRAMLKELHITAVDCPKVKHVWAARYNNEWHPGRHGLAGLDAQGVAIHERDGQLHVDAEGDPRHRQGRRQRDRRKTIGVAADGRGGRIE